MRASPIKTKLKSKKKRSNSSKQWLLRQVNDPYVHKAKEMGYKSRAAFKIIEINKKFHIFKPGQIVVDLGAAPGGWSQITSKLIQPRGQVFALDLLEMDSILNVTFVQGDFTEHKVADDLLNMCGNQIDVVLSDIAPSTCGIAKIDHLRIMMLLEEVFNFCKVCLKPGGVLVAKVFRGGAEQGLLHELKKVFKKISHFKPESSRQESSEIYLIALDFKGYID